jgi:hypothetical protein
MGFVATKCIAPAGQRLSPSCKSCSSWRLFVWSGFSASILVMAAATDAVKLLRAEGLVIAPCRLASLDPSSRKVVRF